MKNALPETFCKHTVRASIVKPEAAAAPSTGDASEVAAPHTTATYRNVARHSAMTDLQSSRVRSSACMGNSCGLAAVRVHRRPPWPGHLFRSSRSMASSIMFRWWSRSVPSSAFCFMLPAVRPQSEVSPRYAIEASACVRGATCASTVHQTRVAHSGRLSVLRVYCGRGTVLSARRRWRQVVARAERARRTEEQKTPKQE